MVRRAPFLLLPALGCSLLFPIDGQPQPCDSVGDCLPGFVCAAGVCTAGSGGPDGGDGGRPGGGCTDSSQCPAGACLSGGCSAVPVAWLDGGSVGASMACYPWPPASSAGGPLVTLSGCLAFFPVSPPPIVQADAGTVQPFEDGFALGAAAPFLAEAACPSGVGYAVQVPPGQLLELAISAGPLDVADDGIFVGADGGRRDLTAISVNGWSSEAKAVRDALELPPSAVYGLLLGLVRDCAGRPLSGVQLSAPEGDGGLAFAYLDDTGAPSTGRTATGPSGRFAAVAPAGSYELSFAASPTAGASPETFAALPVSIGAGGTGLIDLSPSGP
ncbi:MAG: carboxypeptidase-like regulatory domain-containing protein [Myxococcales bacterium]